MSKRSRFVRREGTADKRPDAGSDPLGQGKKNRRIVWAAVLAVAAVGLAAGVYYYVKVYRPAADSASASPMLRDRRRSRS